MAENLFSLIERRKSDLNISQNEIARRMGVQSSQIHKWQTGSHRPQSNRIRDFALALEISVRRVTNAFANSNILVPKKPSPVWIAEDVYPEIQMLLRRISARNPNTIKGYGETLWLHRMWVGSYAPDGTCLLRFPVSEELALAWYDLKERNPEHTLLEFVSELVPRDSERLLAGYEFSSPECDICLDEMVAYLNVRMMLDMLGTQDGIHLSHYPDTSMMRFIELYQYARTDQGFNVDGNRIGLNVAPVMNQMTLMNVRAMFAWINGGMPESPVYVADSRAIWQARGCGGLSLTRMGDTEWCRQAEYVQNMRVASMRANLRWPDALRPRDDIQRAIGNSQMGYACHA